VIINVLDTLSATAQLEEEISPRGCNKTLQQLKCATVVVLNPRSSSEDLKPISGLVALINPRAQLCLLASQDHSLSLAEMTNIIKHPVNEDDINHRPELISDHVTQDVAFIRPPGSHDSAYQTMCVVEAGCNHRERLLRCLENLLEEGHVDRIKGFIALTKDLNPSTIPVPCTSIVLDGGPRGLFVNDCSDLKAAHLDVYAANPSNFLAHGVFDDIVESAAWQSALSEPHMSRIFLSGKGLEERSIREAILEARLDYGFELVASISLELKDVYAAMQTGVSGEFLHMLNMGGNEIALYWVEHTFHAVTIPSDVQWRETGESTWDNMRDLVIAVHDVCVVDDLIYIRKADY